MPEETCDVAETVGFVAVDRVVVLYECLFEEVGPETVDLCKTLAD